MGEEVHAKKWPPTVHPERTVRDSIVQSQIAPLYQREPEISHTVAYSSSLLPLKSTKFENSHVLDVLDVSNLQKSNKCRTKPSPVFSLVVFSTILEKLRKNHYLCKHF